MSIFVGWVLLTIFQQTIGNKLSETAAESHGDQHYDPVGGNAAMIFIGWFPMLISTAGASMLILLIGKLKEWRGERRHPTQPPDKTR